MNLFSLLINGIKIPMTNKDCLLVKGFFLNLAASLFMNVFLLPINLPR